MSEIEKKVVPEYYKEIRMHRRMVEIFRDEPEINAGDILVLREWDGEKYTGNKARRKVTYILRNTPKYGRCVIALHVPGLDEPAAV